MVRALRIEYPGAWHHVMHRGARHRPVFLTDEDRRDWLRLVGRCVDRYGIEVGAFVLMDTHWHLLVHTPKPELSKAMQRLNGVYTQRFNRRNGYDGALFRGRFHSVLIDSDTYLARVVGYIHRNPLEAGMVDRLGDYVWSSFPSFVGDAIPPAWLSSRWQQLTGIRTREAVVDSTIRADYELAAFYSGDREAPILGSAEFVSRHLVNAVLTPETKGHASLSRERPAPGLIDAAVVEAMGVSFDDVRRSSRGVANAARFLAVGLSEEATGLAHSELARHYGYTTGKGVATVALRYRRRLAEDSAFADLVAALRSRLTLDEV